MPRRYASFLPTATSCARANRLRYIVPEFIGDYKLLEEIGSGTFGVVVKARHVVFDKPFAIKLLRGGQWSSSEFVKRFRIEARKQANLDHPHIVPVHQVGEHDGQHYFVMKLIQGGALSERLKAVSDDERATKAYQRWAAELMGKMARAVHHAHQHALIHRDLKPGNILLDVAGDPHITDFGLAKQLEEGEKLADLGPVDDTSRAQPRLRWEGGPEADTFVTEKGVIVGTPPYMSPQQAAGEELTTVSDVYSLGVILYEMLTGKVPHRGDNPLETMRLVRNEAILPPSSLNPKTDRRLENICMKSLEKEPANRYQSALGLARNLERWLANEPLLDPPDPLPARCRLWCRRKPIPAALLVTAAALLMLVTTMVVRTSRVRAERLEEEVLKSNAYAAQGVASMILLQTRRWASAVYNVSENPELRTLVKQGDQPQLHRFLEQIHRNHGGSEGLYFESWYLTNDQGALLACVPEKTQYLGEKFDKRDYFLGALEKVDLPREDSVHVSRAFRSLSDERYRIGFARALRDNQRPGSPIIGVLEASITTGSSFGLNLHDDRRKAVLVGPKDPNPRTGVGPPAAPEQYLILLHPGYKHGEEPMPIQLQTIVETLGPLPNPRAARQLSFADAAIDGTWQATNARYFDPVRERLPQYDGRWLAALAPVGNTGYAVVVQQRYDDAVPSDHDVFWRGAAVLLGVLVFAAIAWLGVQAFRRQNPQSA